MTMNRFKSAALIGLFALSLGAAGGLTGCGAKSHQFEGMLHYGNLMSETRAAEAEEKAKAQLLELADTYGLETRYSGKDRLVFVAQAPNYTVIQPDGAVEERADTRIVKIEVLFGKELGTRAYRYYCRVVGGEPAHFTAEHRARFALSLLAVREIFEKPLSTKFLGS